MKTVLVPTERLERWLTNFGTRHGAYDVDPGPPLVATAADGSAATVHGPWGLPLETPLPEVRWGVLLVRKGGFAVAAGIGREPALRKIGQRHVQGRTKAGGQSQQRFARRRDNQAKAAYDAAADHAHRILVQEFGGVTALVCGGDRAAVDAVLSDRRLAALVDKVTGPWLAVPDPNARVLAAAVADAWSCQIELVEPAE